MDMYRIICPYCQHAHCPNHYDVGFEAMVCQSCEQPFVNSVVLEPVFHSFALVGIEHPTLPTPEEIEQDIKEDPEEILCVECGKPVAPGSSWRLCEQCLCPTPPLDSMPWLPCPASPNCKYRHDGEYVEMKYSKGGSVKTTWSDIHMLCEEDNPTTTIKTLLGTNNSNKVAAVNAFVRAVKEGKVSE